MEKRKKLRERRRNIIYIDDLGYIAYTVWVSLKNLNQ